MDDSPHRPLLVTPINSSQSDTIQVKTHILLKQTN